MTSRKLLMGKGRRPAAAGYSGPGDIVGGAQCWWGLRAYNASVAASGIAAVGLLDAALTHATDIHLLSNGLLDLSNSFFSSFTPPFYIDKLYDQTGNGRDLVGVTRRPVMALTGNGLTVPHIVFTRASGQYLDLNSFTFSLSLPFTFNAVFRRTFTTGQYNGILNVSANTIANNIANQVYMYNGGAGGLTETTATDGQWHNIQAVFTNSVGDTLQVDNKTPLTGTNVGSANISSQNILMGYTATGDYMDGYIAEGGIWAAPAFTGTQLTQMYNNQHLYFGAF
jgi:hypothetical protein